MEAVVHTKTTRTPVLGCALPTWTSLMYTGPDTRYGTHPGQLILVSNQPLLRRPCIHNACSCPLYAGNSTAFLTALKNSSKWSCDSLYVSRYGCFTRTFGTTFLSVAMKIYKWLHSWLKASLIWSVHTQPCQARHWRQNLIQILMLHSWKQQVSIVHLKLTWRLFNRKTNSQRFRIQWLT